MIHYETTSNSVLINAVRGSSEFSDNCTSAACRFCAYSTVIVFQLQGANIEIVVSKGSDYQQNSVTSDVTILRIVWTVNPQRWLLIESTLSVFSDCLTYFCV